ncbi:MAG: hypothetical protein ABFE08_12645, partial [Armatimonadia bacterium]
RTTPPSRPANTSAGNRYCRAIITDQLSQRHKGPNSMPAKRPRPIGPFFLIAILLSAAIFIWQKRQNEARLQTSTPPVIEHQVIDQPETESVPSPDLVRAHADELNLTAPQLRRLDPLVQAYQRELKPLQTEADAAVKRFQSYQQQKQGQKQVPMSEIQEQMSEVSALSSRLAALRQQHWHQVAPILTPRQRAKALKLWQQTLSKPSQGAR